MIDKKAPLNQHNLKSFNLPIGEAILAENIEAIELISPHLDNKTLEWAIEIASNQIHNREIVKVLENAIGNHESNEQ